MSADRQTTQYARGQIIVVFALSITALILLVGLVIDGGYAMGQRRSAQNAADMAALSAARVVASYVTNDLVNGTDQNVVASIDRALSENGAVPSTYGGDNDPHYVSMSGAVLGTVGNSAHAIPTGTAGVSVIATRSWNPFFMGIIGVSNWRATAGAIARGGYRAGGPPGGNLLPFGVAQAVYQAGPICPMGTATASCTVVHLTQGSLNAPGQFGWLKFGCTGPDNNGNPFGLGQVAPANAGGCADNTGFLQSEWGDPTANPPQAPKTYGCCGRIGLPGSGDDIGALPGNKAAVDNSTPGVAYYINNEVIGFAPVWDSAPGNGSNAYYHIIGYAGFQIIGVDGSKNITGILREVIFNGPVTTTSPGFAGAPLSIELIQ